MNETTQTPYLRLHEERAPTLNGSSGIRFAVLADPDRTQVYLTVLSNEGGGNFNKVVVPFADLEAALGPMPAGTPFGTKQLRTAIAGRSSNNHCFYAAVLRHAGLITAAEGAKHKFTKSGDWALWQRTMLELEGEPFLFPPALPTAVKEPAANVELPAPAENSGRSTRRGGKRQIPPALTADGASDEFPATVAQEDEGADREAHP